MKKNPWIKVPKKSEKEWFGEWLISSMIVNALAKNNKLPEYIRLLDNGMLEELKNGGAKLHYETK